MKDGWESRLLGEVCSIQNGYAFDSKRFSMDEGLPLIRIRDLKGGSTTACLYNGEYDERYLVRAGDFLVGMDGDFGCYEWHGPDALLNQRVCRLQGFTGALLPRFLFYGLNQHLREIQANTTFTTVKHLSSKQVLAIQFPVPPLDEQERIVKILDSILEGVASAQALLEETNTRAHKVFQARLADLVDADGSSRERRSLGDLCKRVEYGSSAKSQSTGSVPVLRMGNVQDGEILWEPLVFTSDPNEIAKFSLRPGDVLFNRTNSPALVGKSAIYRGQREAVFAGYLIRVVHDPELLDSEFLNFYLNAPSTRAYGRTVMGKSVNQANISASKLREYPIRIPPIEEQREIARELLALKPQIGDLTRNVSLRSRALNDLRASVLHRAFTGQL